MNGYELYKKLQLNINPNELDEILYHASFQPQNKYLLKRNKEYILWGNTILKAILSLYLYGNNIANDASGISKMSNSMYMDVADDIYETYRLEEFVYVSKGEKGKRHTDIASKLITLLYKTNGLRYTYDFLQPILSKYAKTEKLDYRTILQEFVQKKKLPFEYKIISVEGPDNAPIYTCELCVGNRSVVATGNGKKVAYRNAAEKYITDNQIQVIAKGKSKEKTLNDEIVISSERKEQLIRIFKELHIDTKEFPLNYMNAVFVHKSIHNDKKNNDIYVDNATVSVIGAEVTGLFAFEYIYNAYETEYIDVSKEKSTLIDAMNLQGVLPEKWLKLLVASKSIYSLNREGMGSLKIDVFKAILGGLVLYSIKSKNTRSEETARELAFYFMDRIKANKIPDYFTTLHEVAQETGLTSKEEFQIYDKNGEHNVSFVAILEYSDGKESFKARGETVVTAYSDTKDKDESIRRFKEKEADIILAHPKTLQYGVTFVNCKYAIYYSLSYSFEEYYQSHDRIYRYGQKNVCSFIFLQAEDTIDEVLFECVKNKKSDATIFESLIKDAAEHNVFASKVGAT